MFISSTTSVRNVARYRAELIFLLGDRIHTYNSHSFGREVLILLRKSSKFWRIPIVSGWLGIEMRSAFSKACKKSCKIVYSPMIITD
ncbi:hypothetical protein IQ264_22385 [Phormidium sp. LEGE 05292]|uniref:hypothetical protein n=1 Tax=[Phormidium] sp. LEGE 05292 TaxID=767427 RepID=UPI0018822DC2|nr:hypothetical protein [Phormidium sp. LEGE 05292]MBE9228175.1 hypothetical protein [Phormidium sp. LEGE 05292]